MNGDVNEFFDYIDSCDNIKVMNNINKSLKDEYLMEIFWESFYKALHATSALEKKKAEAKCRYLNAIYSSSVPITDTIQKFATPHGLKGIAISRFAKIGSGCTIFQNVTIGSNTLLDSKSAGFPVIGDNVYIGANVSIIGNVRIGNNVRIGAGCAVFSDVEDNSTVVHKDPLNITRDKINDNKFVNALDYKRLVPTTINPAITPPPPVVDSQGKKKSKDVLYRIMTKEEESKYKNAFRLLFCGDLILLEDQIKNAYTGRGYDFSPMFEYTRKYIKAADFSIGVFEGPCGGTRKNFSQSNYEDGKRLYLNFPDEFVDAVKDAGFDLVTTATNHMVDMDIDGLKRTIQVLDDKKLPHLGTYLNEQHKKENRVTIIEKDGVKMAFLAYVSAINGNNYNDKKRLIDGDLSHMTSMIVFNDNPYYERIKESVREDFIKAKSYNPDLIIVMPHWGIQFTDTPSTLQQLWRDNFFEFGANIILGDHTHSVQPVEITKVNGENTYTLYCPGNYVNIYQKHNGDMSAMVEIYIDRDSKKIIGSSVIPMWGQSQYIGNYRALPIYDIFTDNRLGREIGTLEMERVEQTLHHITNIMLKEELSSNMIQERYYYDENGFFRTKVAPLDITEEMKQGEFYKQIQNTETICFVGDSLTEGTKNGGVPWYEPIEHLIHGKIVNFSKGSCTTTRLLQNYLRDIVNSEADLFVIAIGANDIRYRNELICAMTPEEYVNNLNELRDAVLSKNVRSKFIFIAPWLSTDGDRGSSLRYFDKVFVSSEYVKALEKWCKDNGDIFINANDYISRHLDLYPHSKYLLDAIHPNASKGVKLYAEAVLKS